MSSLCKRHFATMNKNNLRPSPKLRRNLSPCNISFPEHPLNTAKNIKRISLRMLLKKTIKASMTVETAMVLPLFCFFMIHMGSAIEMIRLHGNIEVALWNAGRQVGIYEDLLSGEESSDDSEKEGWNGKLEAAVLSYTYIKNQIASQLGEEYLEQAPLENGIEGLQCDLWPTKRCYRADGKRYGSVVGRLCKNRKRKLYKSRCRSHRNSIIRDLQDIFI